MASVLFQQMVKTRTQRADLGLGSELREHECVDEPAEQVPVTQYSPLLDTEGSGHQRRIDNVALWPLDTPRQSVGASGRQCLKNEQIRQQPLIGSSGHPADPGSVANYLRLKVEALPRPSDIGFQTSAAEMERTRIARATSRSVMWSVS